MYTSFYFFTIIWCIATVHYCNCLSVPLVINTWAFSSATDKAWEYLLNGFNRLDALEAGCRRCQELQCDGTVGYGGSPDENGETTLDALIFDGATMNMGAVGGLRHIKDAVSVARCILENTDHSLLVGSLATKFAIQMGFPKEPLSTNKSINIWTNWKKNNCQPNFWMHVKPNPHTSCGPYEPTSANSIYSRNLQFSSKNHDTIGMVIVDKDHNIVAGTSSNGANHKIPGRVGDSPIPGAGAYADNEVGAAVATGDGDIMMRFLPSFLAVEEMRRGKTPSQAAKEAIARIAVKYPNFFGGLIAVNTKGEYGAACNGMDAFPFSIISKQFPNVTIKKVKCH